jgi:hypothetical protein
LTASAENIYPNPLSEGIAAMKCRICQTENKEIAMKNKTACIACLCLLFIGFGPIDLQAKKSRIIALVGAQLIDGTGANPINDSAIIIEGDTIKAVGPADKVTIPEDAEKIDVSGKLADLQVVSGNPLKSLEILGNPEMVMVGGKIHNVIEK